MKTEEIKASRVRKRLSARYVASELNVCYDTYRKKESGIYRFTLDEVVKMADLYGWTYSDVNNFIFDGRLPTA